MRRDTWFAVLAWVAVVALVVGFVAGKGMRPADSVKAKQFVLVDDKGEPRAALWLDPTGTPCLSLGDTVDHHRPVDDEGVAIRVLGSRGGAVLKGGPEPGVYLAGPNMSYASLAVRHSTSAAGRDPSRAAPELSLFGDRSQVRALVGEAGAAVSISSGAGVSPAVMTRRSISIGSGTKGADISVAEDGKPVWAAP